MMFRLCRDDEISFDIEATFNFVKRIVRHVAFDSCFDTVAGRVDGASASFSRHIAYSACCVESTRAIGLMEAEIRL